MKLYIPANIENFLDIYIDELSKILPTALKGVYLYGSIALGDYNEFHSDIDFIVVLNTPLTSGELNELDLLHDKLLKKYEEAKKFDGIFIQQSDVGKMNSDLTPYPYSHDGIFYHSGHWDINNVTWWILKKYGIVLMGSKIEDLSIEVSVKDLRATMDYNLNSYWKEKSDGRFREDEEITWAVMTLCRIKYTLETDEVISKGEATKYGLENISVEWNVLLKECLRIWEKSSDESLYKSMDQRANEVSDFIKYIIKTCNEVYFKNA